MELLVIWLENPSLQTIRAKGNMSKKMMMTCHQGSATSANPARKFSTMESATLAKPPERKSPRWDVPRQHIPMKEKNLCDGKYHVSIPRERISPRRECHVSKSMPEKVPETGDATPATCPLSSVLVPRYELPSVQSPLMTCHAKVASQRGVLRLLILTANRRAP